MIMAFFNRFSTSASSRARRSVTCLGVVVSSFKDGFLLPPKLGELYCWSSCSWYLAFRVFAFTDALSKSPSPSRSETKIKAYPGTYFSVILAI